MRRKEFLLSPNLFGCRHRTTPRYLRMTLNTLRLVMFARLEQMKRWACLGIRQSVCDSGNTMLLPFAIGKRSAFPPAQAKAVVVDRNIRSLWKRPGLFHDCAVIRRRLTD